MFRICKQMFKVEDLVVVTGLKKDKDLNGAMGIVVGHAPDKVDKSITRHKVRTLDYRMKVPHVIKVPQPNGGCKIVLYDFLIEIRLSEMNSLLHFCTSF